MDGINRGGKIVGHLQSELTSCTRVVENSSDMVVAKLGIGLVPNNIDSSQL